MRMSRSALVTCCQQALVTATVGAVAITAAGVVTLDIVAPAQESAGQTAPAAQAPSGANGVRRAACGAPAHTAVAAISSALRGRAPSAHAQHARGVFDLGALVPGVGVRGVHQDHRAAAGEC